VGVKGIPAVEGRDRIEMKQEGEILGLK